MILPTPPLGHYVWPIRTPLDGVMYRLLYRYNGVDGYWRLQLLKDDRSVITPMKRLVEDDDLFRQFKYDESYPQGALAVVLLTGTSPPGRDDLGVRVRLEYTS